MSDPMLLDDEPIPTRLVGATARRVRHRSRDVNGTATESTGLVVVPDGGGPDGGRPVLTWCHGTTGLGDAGCPSAQPDPARPLEVYFSAASSAQIDYGVPGIQEFLDEGWVVCATDYQGLGTPGVHHYTINRSNARDALGIVHAARELGIGAGARVAAAGWSQGGGAAAAVAELDDEDFGDLELVGAVAMSPGVPTMGLADPSGMGEALSGADVPPDAHLLMNLYALAAVFPELDLDDVLTPLGRSVMDEAWNHQPVHHLDDTLKRVHQFRGPVMAVDRNRLGPWAAAMGRASAAQVAPRCPVLVCVDGFAGGTVLPVGWQRAYASAVEALGGTVTVREYPDDDHFSLPDACVSDARAWLNGLLRVT